MKTIIYLILVITLVLNSAYSKHLKNGKNFNVIKSHQQPAAFSNVNHHSSLSSSSSNEKESQILRYDNKINGDGTYHYDFETSNGIKRTEQGAIDGTIQGSSSYISPEGIEIKTTYVADETGYHPVGDHIPKIPDYIVRALEYIRTHPYIEKDYYTGEVKHKKTLTTTTKNSANNKQNNSRKIGANSKHNYRH